MRRRKRDVERQGKLDLIFYTLKMIKMGRMRKRKRKKRKKKRQNKLKS